MTRFTDWHDREEDAVADHATWGRAFDRVILECDIASEAKRRAERIVRRTMRDAHPFARIEAATPIRKRLIHKLRVKAGVADHAARASERRAA